MMSYGTGDEQLVILVNILITLMINCDGMTLSLASFVLDQLGCGLWAFAFSLLVCPVCFHEGICLHFPEVSLSSFFACGSLSRILGSLG